MSPAGLSSYQGETAIAVNKNDVMQVVAGANTFYRDPSAACQSPTGGAANTYGTQALYGSSDGGSTWSYKCAPWGTSVTGGCPAGGGGGTAFFGSDPAVAWDANGNAYAVYMLASEGYNALGQATCVSASINISISTDAGASWSFLSSIVNNLNNGATVFDDKDLVAIDTTSGQARSHTNRIYVIWDENNVERIAYSDNGTSWTTVVLDSSATANCPASSMCNIGGNVTVGSDGTLYVIWNRMTFDANDYESGETTVFSKSIDGGATWSSPVTVATHTLISFGSYMNATTCYAGATCNNRPPAQDQRGINAFGSLGVDASGGPYNGRLYVVYTDLPAPCSGNPGSCPNDNVYLSYSSNGGSNWSAPLILNDDGGASTQFFPWLSVDQTDGSVHVSWLDTRADANNKQTQSYYTTSTNGGTSFAANTLVCDNGANFNNKVSYSDENSTDNTSYNGNQYGDYTGISALAGVAHPIWTDSRQFYPSAANDFGGFVEDAATASVVSCTPPAAPTGVTAAASAPNEITVSWTASAGASSYNVYRGSGACPGSGYVLLAPGVTGTSYIDSSVQGGVTYSYEVTAVASCESGVSACASATATGYCTLPPTFSGITSETVGAGGTCGVTLNWNAGSSNCGSTVSYDVYRSQVSGFTPSASTLIAQGLTGTSFTDTQGLTPGGTYYYVVRAADDGTGVEDSNTVGNTTAATLPGSCAAGAVPIQVLTVTSTNGQNLLEWLNPTSGPANSTILINYRTDQYPTSPTDALATTLVSGRTVTFGATDSYAHTGLANGTKYYYAVWVRN